MVTEADDPADVLHDTAKFAPFLDFTVYPVLDVAEGVGVTQEAIEYRNSVG